jgi:F0F1-type ATP synthase epsilon subunit
MTDLVHVTIKDRDSVLYEGDVTAVSAYNDVGLFDVLPMHENFITLIKSKVILHKNEAQKEFPIENGLLKVRENKVSIYVEF